MVQTPDFPDVSCSLDLVGKNSVELRPSLLRTISDLYVRKETHTLDEAQHFTELVLGLFDLVDSETRLIVADKIARYPTVPVAIRRRILREYVSGGFQPNVSAVPGLFPVGSPSIDELNELFFAASATERHLILRNLHYAALPRAANIPQARTREAINWLEAAALGRNLKIFAHELERTLKIPHAQAQRVTEDPSGEPIVMVAVILGMAASVLQRIVLCLNPAMSILTQRVYDLVMLYEEVEIDTALRLLSIWQASGTTGGKPIANSAIHQPHNGSGNVKRLQLRLAESQ